MENPYLGNAGGGQQSSTESVLPATSRGQQALPRCQYPALASFQLLGPSPLGFVHWSIPVWAQEKDSLCAAVHRKSGAQIQQ